MKTSLHRLVILDSLRGLASLIVLFHHVFKLNALYFQELNHRVYIILEFVSNLNQQAVLFFFILSGFSIGLSLKRLPLTSSADVNNYYYRRFKRILPIYWIALIISFICGILTNTVYTKDFSFYNFSGNIFFLQTSSSATPAWFTPYGLNGPLWSLAFEFFFYVLFPITYIFDKKYLTGYSSLFKYFILSIATICSIAVNRLLFVPYFLFFGNFILWVLGYLISQTYIHRRRYDKIFVVSFILSAFCLYVENRYHLSRSIYMISNGLIISSFYYFFVVVGGFANALFFKSIVSKLSIILNNLFSTIGRGSYAMYAFHYPLLLTFNYYNLTIEMQIVVLVLFVFLCILVEERLIKYSFSFLKKNYVTY
ncbi:acyltransferase family protein [uncultured Fibrella sp.]|uniref:acyltransferase family protein n=1 Tax=uncultured Fibrella sp. TaxID=1284596 RepID=UPI0035CA4D5F